MAETLRKYDVHIIDEGSVEGAVDEIKNVLGHMTRMENLITEEAESVLKIIVAQMKPDYVNPYKKWGSFIPFVLYSTHPRYVKTTRLDKGYTSLALDSGYLIIIINSDGKGTIPVKEYMKSDWKSRKGA